MGTLLGLGLVFLVIRWVYKNPANGDGYKEVQEYQRADENLPDGSFNKKGSVYQFKDCTFYNNPFEETEPGQQGQVQNKGRIRRKTLKNLDFPVRQGPENNPEEIPDDYIRDFDVENFLRNRRHRQGK